MKKMKKNILYKVLPFILLVLSFSSCNEDNFLDISAKGSLTNDTYLTTSDEIETAIIALYNNLQEAYSSGYWTSIYFVKNLPSDDCNAGSTIGDQSGYQELDDFDYGADNVKTEAVWTNLYKIIYGCNTIINNVTLTDDTSLDLIAEAKAIRGFSFFNLVQMFGGVPLRLVNASSESEYPLARSTAEEVYAQIETDFTDAIEKLPLKSTLSSDNKYRFSKGAAQGFLGKVYLYEKKYSQAVTQFNYVITSGEYSLIPDYDDIWTSGEEFGLGSLFEISYTSGESYDWGNFPWTGGNESNIEIVLQGPRDAVYDLSGGTFSFINGWGFNIPTSVIGNAYANAGDTERGDANVMSEANFIAAGGAIVDESAHDYEGYVRMKYSTYSSETVTDGIKELNFGTNWRLLRYADILLMAAEANHFNSDDATATSLINQVRTRAGLGNFSGDIFDAIVTERQLELSFEGVRFWDLVRWGLAADKLSSRGFTANKNELFPIPTNEIIGNSAITTADQNPGY